jgi:predicted enzyme related to lactoylglutathione lyase
MSPTKRTARKPVRKTIKRVARKPAPPPRLNADFRDVNVVAYNVTDWARAIKFYHETLGLPIAFQVESAGWVEFGLPNQTHLALNRWDDPKTVPPNTGNATLVLGVDDARGVIAKLRAKGVRCEEPIEIPGMVIYGTFYDPDGNRLQVAQSSQ